MNKEEFLKTLRKKLSILEESEIEDILNEYEGYIEEKIAKGSSEEEAVASMGNVNELSRELLSAYKIKNPQEKHDTFSNLADECLHIFEKIVEMFVNKSFNEILRFIFEIIMILVIIAICKIPFEIVASVGREALRTLGIYSTVIGRVWNFVLEFIYLIFAILMFIKIFESRYLTESEEVKPLVEKDVKSTEKKKDKRVEEKVKKETEHSKEINRRPRLGVIDSLASLCMLFTRIVAFFILLGVVFYIIGLATMIGIIIYLLVQGVFYFGIYLILFSLFALGIIAFIFLFNFVYNRKSKVGILLISSLISFIVLGVGAGVCALEFANTTIIYSETPEIADHWTEETYTFTMQDDLVLGLDVNNRTHVIVDDTLGDAIKVVYTYDKAHIELMANPHISNTGRYPLLYLGHRITRLHYSKDDFNAFIANLKNKTIYAINYDFVDVKVYVSNATKEKLATNQSKQYYHSYSNSLEDICEELYDRGYNVPSYCHPYIDTEDM